VALVDRWCPQFPPILARMWHASTDQHLIREIHASIHYLLIGGFVGPHESCLAGGP
jgi:hypothetical protein